MWLLLRYMVQRTFPDGLAIPSNQQGRDTTAKVAAKNAEGGVTWVHSYATPDNRKDLLHLRWPERGCNP